MSKKYEAYIERKRQETIKALTKVERDWLKSICAPVDQLPDDVADAVYVRQFLTRLPHAASYFIAYTQCDEEIENLRKAAGIETESEILSSWLQLTIEQTRGKSKDYEGGYIDGMRATVELIEKIENSHS